jgi:hypothetical protein
VGHVEANDLVAIEGIGETDLDLDESLLSEMLLCIRLLFVLKWLLVYPDRYFNATAMCELRHLKVSLKADMHVSLL